LVAGAAAALAALIVEPIFAKSDAADASDSGFAKTKDIPDLPITTTRVSRVFFGLFFGRKAGLQLTICCEVMMCQR
jgi:hypothetical protein